MLESLCAMERNRKRKKERKKEESVHKPLSPVIMSQVTQIASPFDHCISEH
jgi:hypothetical protein